MARTRTSSKPTVRPLRKREIARAAELWTLAYHVRGEDQHIRMMNRTRLADCCGVDVGGEVVAVGRLLPMKVTLAGRAFGFGGVASLATAVEARRRGHIRAILGYMLETMRDRGMVLSGLYPFDSGFYRRYGWAMADATCSVQLPTRYLTVRGRSPGRVVPVPLSRASTLRRLHDAWGARYNLSQRRDAWWYRHYLARDGFAFYRYDGADGTPEGYVNIHFAAEEQGEFQVLYVRELVATTPTARAALLAFLGDFDSEAKRADLLLPASDPLFAQLRSYDEATVKHNYDYTAMARIVDVQGLLDGWSDLGGGKSELVLEVEDEHAPWNQGAWRVGIASGRSKVRRARQAPDCTASIQTLTQLATGYLSPAEAVDAGLVTGPHADAISLIARFSGRRAPFHNDFY